MKVRLLRGTDKWIQRPFFNMGDLKVLMCLWKLTREKTGDVGESEHKGKSRVVKRKVIFDKEKGRERVHVPS